MNYCCKDHQKIDWSLGGHKTTCGNGSSGNEQQKYFLKEWDLVTEAEKIDDTTTTTNEEDEEAQRLRDYEEFVSKNKKDDADDVSNEPDEEFEKYIAKTDDDKVFHKFKKRVSKDPEQVIRFDRGGTPLWITTQNQALDSDISPCNNCNEPRIFEFQVSLLNNYRYNEMFFVRFENLLNLI